MFRLIAVVALALCLPSLAAASPITYQASLSGAKENPPVVSTGTGTTSLTLDTAAHTLALTVSFSGLGAGVTAAHIHCCVAPPGVIGVASPTPTLPGFPSAVSAGTYSQIFDLTQATSWNATFIANNGGTAAGAEAALAAGLAAGSAYFNIHTTNFPGGEIRGFYTPEPSSALLLGAGLFGLGVRRRTRSH